MARRRKTTCIVVHCTDTPDGRDVSADDIDRWHLQRGWSGIGYHWVVRLDGTIEPGRDLRDAGAHVRGRNSSSVGVCLVGGRARDGTPSCDYTRAQWVSLTLLLYGLEAMYPEAEIVGHCDLDTGKVCPCFDVAHWWRTGEVLGYTEAAA